jgi:zinc-binding alcohol dehydrogenase/oxidoreductase
MKAAVLTGVNQPLRYQDAPEPQPGPNEVVIQLRAAALNHRDVWIQKGLYAGLKFPVILGSDGAGVVTALGDGVESRWLGRAVIIHPGIDWGENPLAQKRQFRVLGLPDEGAFAQYVKVPVANICAKPAHLNWQEAAALPLAGITAYRGLFTRANLLDHDRVLVTGIGGGVAVFAMQLAAVCGAQVYVTSSSDEKLAQAQSLGAAGGLNYRDPDWAKKFKETVGGFEVIVDGAGGDDFGHLVDLAVPGGRIVVYGATQGLPKNLDLRRVFWKQLSILGTTMGTMDDFEALLHFASTRHLIPVVDQVFPLAEAEAAIRRMDEGKQFGKIVLAIE